MMTVWVQMDDHIEGSPLHTDLGGWSGSLRLGRPGSQLTIYGTARQLRSLAEAAARLAREVGMLEAEEKSNG